MDVLVLGGTSFVGRAIVEDLLTCGHRPTLFSRGRTGAELFPELERRLGDRDSGDYASLAEGRWDATVDVSGYVPRHVGQAGDALGARGGRRLFLSTGSVYDRLLATDGLTEDSPRLPAERGTEEITGQTYGPLKVACEDDLRSRYDRTATIVRPGIVAGPYDPTDRFTYWARRADRGGRLAVPGRLDQPVQVVDSRDLARLVTLLLEQDRDGTYNAVGPADPVTLGSLVTRLGGEPVAVEPRPGFPLVLPDTSWDVMFRRSRAAADAVGMPATPLEQTAADVLAWDVARGLPPLAHELTAEQEAELLGAAER